MHKKLPKICTGCRVSEAKIYLYHCTEVAKARPHSEEWQTDTSVQKQWSMINPIAIRGSRFNPTHRLSPTKILTFRCPCMLRSNGMTVLHNNTLL